MIEVKLPELPPAFNLGQTEGYDATSMADYATAAVLADRERVAQEAELQEIRGRSEGLRSE